MAVVRWSRSALRRRDAAKHSHGGPVKLTYTAIEKLAIEIKRHKLKADFLRRAGRS